MDNTSCIISEDYSNFVNIEDIIKTPEEDDEDSDLYTSKYTEKDLADSEE